MRTAIPFILISLAVFTAVCIAYIAWELSSSKPDEQPGSVDDSDSGTNSP